MKLRDLMRTNVARIGQDSGIMEAARVMRDRNVGCLVVGNGGTIEGIITDRDIAVGCVAEGRDIQQCKVRDYMSSPVETAAADMDVLEASHLMIEKQIKRLPVQEGGRLAGLVSLSDIAQAMQQPMHDLLAGMGAARRGG